MGKQKNKKGKGAEKTKEKELKKSDKRLQKELSEMGEEDIQNIISKYENDGRGIKEVTESKTTAPSARCNMTLNAHPEKDLLMMFGGEYYNGSQTTLYNDLFFYNIKGNDWSLVTSPSAPSPRCSHQAVTFAQNGGEMWLFGGEYVSPSQKQYYHFNDLWVLSLSDKTWLKINLPGGPSSRSGHRMVACRKMIFIFGGFRDNTVTYQYFNDMHAFCVESRVWLKLSLSGVPPCPRSGCVMAVTQDQMNVLVYGGYSKERVSKAVDKGSTHSDMLMLSVDVKSRADSKSTWLSWRWTGIKQSGCIPLPMCSTSLVVTSSNRAVLFGGIRDQDEDEEHVEGHCLNDMHYLEIDKGRWHQLKLKKPNIDAKKRRRKDKGIKDLKLDEDNNFDDDNDDENTIGGDDNDDGEEEGDTSKKAKVSESGAGCKGDSALFNFNVACLNQTNSVKQESLFDDDEQQATTSSDEPFIPSARMRPMMAAKRGLLYLYGGVREESGRHLILADLHCIDIQHMEQWRTLITPAETPMDWIDSSSEEDDDEDDDDDSSEEAEDEDADDDPSASGPRRKLSEDFEGYLQRTMEVWQGKAVEVAKQEGIQADQATLCRAAKKMAKEYWGKIHF